MRTVIIQYNAGNTRSVLYALERLGADACLSADPEDIRSAGRIIIPGVGAAAPAMQLLRAQGLDEEILRFERPVLGICLGMQLMCAHSEEGDVSCMGIFKARVRKLTGSEKVPHTGWNRVYAGADPLFQGIEPDSYFYFSHSYCLDDMPQAIGRTVYGSRFASAVQVRNFYGVQFHPEKSGVQGLRLLSNFLEL